MTRTDDVAESAVFVMVANGGGGRQAQVCVTT